jgi:hypothetical protein
VFVAEPIDGEPVTGKLAALDANWMITLSGAAPLSGANLVALGRKERGPISPPSGSQVLLANGDRIRAIAQGASQESLYVNSELLGDMEIPLERVRAVLVTPPGDARTREQLCLRLTSERRKQDAVILANGDELTGTFTGLTDAAVQLDSSRGNIEVNRTEVRAVAMSSELISMPKLTRLFSQAILADGSELALERARLDGATLRATAAFGRDVSIPLEQLVSLEFRNGRLTYLSDMTPAGYRHTPYLNVSYDYQLDRSVLGNPLSLRGQTFRKGLGLHSRSELTYELDGRHHRFEAVVGVDDETAGQGSVVFRLLLDGQQAWESQPLTGRSAAVPVRVNLGSAKRLALVVDFADKGDVQDHADWLDARLVR